MTNKPPHQGLSADGLLVIDKPPRLSSAQVVERIKRLTRPKRIGHTGTLDPFATGVLVLCFNQATKLAGFLMDQDKIYEGTMLLGIETDTLDPTGQVIRRAPVAVSLEAVVEAGRIFVGQISQRPPAYSALKRDGERLYDKARRGEAVEVGPREVTIYSLKVTRTELPRVEFEVHCSKGTYVRALARDWGKALGCGGHLESLRRLQAGSFSIEQALLLGQIEALAARRSLASRLIPPAKALPEWPRLVLSPEAANKIINGQALESDELTGLSPRFLKLGQRLKLTDSTGQLIALAELASASGRAGLKAHPIRVLQV